MNKKTVDKVIQEVGVLLLEKGVPSPAVTALSHVLPVLLPWAIRRISTGVDPAVDHEVLMTMAEEQVRALEVAKFGPPPTKPERKPK